MATCPSCGNEVAPGSRFCAQCGAAVTVSAEAGARKTVSIVFSDLVGSTTLGERVDAESLRALLRRYFAEMRSVVESHGGRVEKFIGDAVMAAFGVPAAHEDDALRAVRAAADMRARLILLNDELERDFGVRLASRTGVNTGEIVAGDVTDAQGFVTGDVVNVAARLEQSAAAGEILVGGATFELVAHGVRAEPVEPLSLKGKTEPVRAWRVLEVFPDVPAFTRDIDAPFVGRETELRALERAVDEAVERRQCVLVTVVGPAGIGKSRLVREFVGRAPASAEVVVGRCLSYGEGITYWPLLEIVKQLAGHDPQRALASLLGGEEDAHAVAERVAGAVGIGAGRAQPEETFWAVRRLFETLARRRPLIVIVDDVHWAESPMLDLLEYVASFATDAPLVLLCLARDDLFEERPTWATPRPHWMVIALEPLTDSECRTLIGRRLGAELRSRVEERVVETAGGNPLFVEQLLALNAEDGANDRGIVVPATMQALLNARLDRLTAEERAVLERGAVEGRSFHRGAILEMLPEEVRAGVAGQLISLVRKELIRPDRALFAGDDGFRFSHVLVRDATYEAMPKALRARLHEEYADWLQRASAARPAEYEEIVGYHLEQACALGAELGPAWARDDLRERASERLSSAGRRALAAGDHSSATSLLRRSAAVLPSGHPARPALLPDVARALAGTGDLAAADTLLQEALTAATGSADRVLELHALIGRAVLRSGLEPRVDADELVRLAQRAIPVFDEFGDEGGLARSWWLVAWFNFRRFEFAASAEAAERAFDYAWRAGDRREQARLLGALAMATLWGPTPVDEGLRRLDSILDRGDGARVVEAFVLRVRSALTAMQGRFDEARVLISAAKETYAELGHRVSEAGSSIEEGEIARLAGDPQAAVVALRNGYDALGGTGDRWYRATVAGRLGLALCEVGRCDEAEPFAGMCADTAARDDLWSQSAFRLIRSRVLAARGVRDDAEMLAREAIELMEPTDALHFRAEGLTVLAQIVGADEAANLAARARELYKRKGNVGAPTRDAVLG